LGTTTLGATGGTGSQAVSAPNTGTVNVAWTYTGNDITGAGVTWTPAAAKVYKIIVTSGATTGTFTPPTTGTVSRTDYVTLAATDPATVSTAEVVISE
jgi:hypothetical protein